MNLEQIIIDSKNDTECKQNVQFANDNGTDITAQNNYVLKMASG